MRIPFNLEKIRAGLYWGRCGKTKWIVFRERRGWKMERQTLPYDGFSARSLAEISEEIQARA